MREEVTRMEIRDNADRYLGYEYNKVKRRYKNFSFSKAEELCKNLAKLFIHDINDVRRKKMGSKFPRDKPC